jgi:hypothetical protein
MCSIARTSLAPALALGCALFAAPASAADDGTWQQFETVPISRRSHSTAFDPVHRRMYLFGGIHIAGGTFSGDSRNLGDTWMLSLDAPRRWTRLDAPGFPAGEGGNAVMIHDPVRNRLVAVSGSSATTVRALPLEGTLQWTTLTPSGIPPYPVAGAHAGIYDPLRDRVVLYCGFGYEGEFYGHETWELSLAGGGAWSQIATGGYPEGTTGGVAYDPTRDRMVLWGDTNGPFWTYVLPLAPGSEWEAYVSGSPNPGQRPLPSLVYSPSSDRVVLFGGGVASGNAWTLQDLGGSVSWASVSATGPPGNELPSSIWDTETDVMIETAPGAGGAYAGLTDLWRLDLLPTPQWTHDDVPRPPLGRISVPIVLDAAHDRIVAYDGTPDVKVVPLSNLADWMSLAPTGSIPDRTFHTATLDQLRNRMLVIGGTNLSQQVWQLFLGATPAWSLVTTAGTPPSARYGHTTIYDPVRDRMIVFGGKSSGVFNDVWALSLSGTPTWSQLTPTGSPPSARESHSAIYDPVRDRIIVSGGTNGTDTFDDAWALQLSGTPAWTQLSSPGASLGHAAIYEPVGDRMVIFGGLANPFDQGSWSFNKVRSLDTASNTWTTLSPAGVTPVRRGQLYGVYDPARRRMITYGGKYVGLPDQLGQSAREPLGDINVLQWERVLSIPTPGVSGTSSLVTRIQPNPGRELQTIELSLATPGAPAVEILDLSGRRVWQEQLGSLPAGTHHVVWGGRDRLGDRVPAGVYFARISGTAGAKRLVRVE